MGLIKMLLEWDILLVAEPLERESTVSIVFSLSSYLPLMMKWIHISKYLAKTSFLFSQYSILHIEKKNILQFILPVLAMTLKEMV